MIRIVTLLGLSLLVTAPVVSASARPAIFIQNEPTTHKVVAGETLYALSRKYGVSVAELTKANPEVKAGLKVGQILRIPTKTPATETAKTVPAKPVPAKPEAPKPAPAAAPKATAAETETVWVNGKKVHKVAAKQNLYKIAVKYGVTMQNIRDWNNLTSDALKIGQELVVADPGNTAPANSATVTNEAVPLVEATVVKSEVKAKNDKVKTETKTVSTPVVVETVPDNEGESKTNVPVVKGSDGTTYEVGYKTVETGMAELIPQADDKNKYLALHKTAPIGTILQVKNIMNGQNVYVRVIGKLPDTGANDKVIVRISKKAYQRLAALDNRFRVEVSYMP